MVASHGLALVVLRLRFQPGLEFLQAGAKERDVAQSFEQAIDEREAAGQVLDNRLVRIDKAQIVEASLVGRTAHVTIQFDADIAAITRDKDGQIIAGTMTDAVATHDLWTFTREIGHADPNWKLSETDEAQ